jgi:hypothetical protein
MTERPPQRRGPIIAVILAVTLTLMGTAGAVVYWGGVLLSQDPVQLQASLVGCCEINLVWAGQENVSGVRVIRDGSVVAKDVEEDTYVDSNLEEKTSYDYVVEAPARWWGPPSRSNTVQVEVPEPALVEAQLDGEWEFELSAVGRAAGGETLGGISLTFEGDCARQPCARVKVMAGAKPVGLMKRSGTLYTGVISHDFVRCSGGLVNAEGLFTLRVRAGEMEAGAWHAKDATGKILVEIGRTGGCPGGLLAWTFTGESLERWEVESDGKGVVS